MAIGSIGSVSQYDPAKMAAKVISAFDSNADQTIDKSEFVAGMKKLGVSQADAEKLFSSIDTSGSGKITEADLQSFIQKNSSSTGTTQTRHGGHGGGHGAPPAGGARSTAGASSSSSTTTYDPRDTNHDGKVSVEEEVAYAATQAQGSTLDTTA